MINTMGREKEIREWEREENLTDSAESAQPQQSKISIKHREIVWLGAGAIKTLSRNSFQRSVAAAAAAAVKTRC